MSFLFLALVAIFVQRSTTILAIFDKLHQGIIRMKLF